MTHQVYLQDYYTYKERIPGWPRVVADPGTPEESQIQAHLLNGNQAYFQGQYPEALEHYLAAWSLLPVLVMPAVPFEVWRRATDELLGVDLTASLLELSAMLHRFREMVGPVFPVPTPADPPKELLAIAERRDFVIDTSHQSLDEGLALLRSGSFKAAEQVLTKTLLEGGQSDAVRSRAMSLLAATRAASGDLEGARTQLQKAEVLYAKGGRKDAAAAVRYNLGVVEARAGNQKEAARYLADSSHEVPVRLPWRITHKLNPGIETIERPMGRDGLPLLVETTAGWNELSLGTDLPPKDQVTVHLNGSTLNLDLLKGGQAIETTILKHRAKAKTLAELKVHLHEPTQFVTYLAHVQGFVLPMAIGDTYLALGDHQRAVNFYLKARDYPYLNLAVERPIVWTKLARTYVRWGQRLYRHRNMEGACEKYEHVVKLVGGQIKLEGPLYSGAFSGLKSETRAFLKSENRLQHTLLDHARRIVLAGALASLRQILAGINYLGFPENIIPVHSWRYLQNLARYFANQAIQAERAYISFKDRSEQETFTRLNLEQAVDAQEAALMVEDKRVAASHEQREAAGLAADLADVRWENARAERDDYSTTSIDLGKLEEISAWVTAPMGDAEVGQYGEILGLEATVEIGGFTFNKSYKEYTIAALAAKKRASISRAYELRKMQRTIDELAASRALADQQVDVADAMIEVANAQRELAALRHQQAQAQLANFDAQTFTPELWDNLADAQREISRTYLDRAIGTAFLMERAFEFEYDLNVDRIRFDYERSELQGLLAADFLLSDIDQFSYDRALDTQKRVPVKAVVSLADRYPRLFYHGFQQTGRIDFEVLLEDLDRQSPGSHLRKLRRVEVVVEGLVGPAGLHGTLKNAGISHYRDRDGDRRVRIQRPETLILSRFDMRYDGFVFTPDEDVLQIFENTGPAGGWILEFPPEANDVDLRWITNIHVVFYFDAFHSDHVGRMVHAELALEDPRDHSVGLALRNQFPDAFFEFQDTGEVEFEIGRLHLPHHHTDARVRDAFLFVETTDGVPVVGLQVAVRPGAGEPEIIQESDTNGMVNTDHVSAPLNAVRGLPVAGSWRVRVPLQGNGDAVAAGFSWDNVRNIYLFLEYTYTPRGLAIHHDDFAADPLAGFDAVDDPGATQGGASSWSHDATASALVQTSNTYGGTVGGPSPNKPGTYLVRHADPAWPPVRDFVLRTRFKTPDNDGIGLVFRYQDMDNFYYVLIDSERHYRRLGRKVGGTFEELSLAALDPNHGYTVGDEHELAVAAVGDAFVVHLDGAMILRGRDGLLAGPGRTGLFTWANRGAKFLELVLERFPRDSQ